MEKNKIEYKEALKKAQDLGIAETDPILGVEGWETATSILRDLINIHHGFKYIK